MHEHPPYILTGEEIDAAYTGRHTLDCWVDERLCYAQHRKSLLHVWSKSRLNPDGSRTIDAFDCSELQHGVIDTIEEEQ